MTHRFLLPLFLTTITLGSIFPAPLLAQEEEVFEEYGKRLFLQITDTGSIDAPEIIRISEYLDLIDQQPVNDHKKQILKHEVNESFHEIYESWLRSLNRHKENYTREAYEGASFEYLNTRSEKLTKMENTYRLTTNFVYRKGQVQNRVSFFYDVAWLPGQGKLVMFGPLREEF